MCALEAHCATPLSKPNADLLVTLGDVLFAFNMTELSAQAAPRLDNGNNPQAVPGPQAADRGYTDSVGGDSYNRICRTAAARAVPCAGAARVDSSRITARGYVARLHPVADNASPGKDAP